MEFAGRIGRYGVAIAVAALILCLGAMCGPADAGAHKAKRAPKQFFGIVMGPGFDKHDFGQLRPAGVRSARFMINWPTTEPHPGEFTWGPTDHIVASFAEHGIQPFPYVFGSPAWLGFGDPVRPPNTNEEGRFAWHLFLKKAVERYGPAGTFWQSDSLSPSRYEQLCDCDAPPRPIKAWEIWNEPNLARFFAPKPSARKYVDLLHVANDAIKGEDPDAQVIIGGLVGVSHPNSWVFLRRIYRVDGAKQDFDGVGLHPYPNNVFQLKKVMRRVRQVMRQHHDRKASTWITEIGWGSKHPNRFNLNKGIKGQRRLLARSFRVLISNRHTWNLRRNYWFTWRDPKGGKASCGFCGSSGLLHYNRKPKPAFHAYRKFALTRRASPWRSR